MDTHPHRRRPLIPLLGLLAGALLIVPAVVVYNAPADAAVTATATASPWTSTTGTSMRAR